MEQVLENATSLAWLGDAVMAVAVREYLLDKGYTRPNDLQRRSIRYCSAKAQAALLDRLLEEKFFNEDELEILRRGRNASVHTKAKNADLATYMKATALEALIGYLRRYHHDDRLTEVLEACLQTGETL